MSKPPARMHAEPRPVQVGGNPIDPEMHDLYQIVKAAFYSLLVLMILLLATTSVTNALMLWVIAFDSGLWMIVHIFVMISIRAILKKNAYNFSYGTGKLENFSSLLSGALMIPTALFFLYAAFGRFLYPPEKILFGLSQLPMLISLGRSLWLWRWAARLIRKHGRSSPMLHAYAVSFEIAAVTDLGVILVLAVGWSLIEMNLAGLGYMLDPAISALIAGYMLINGIRLITSNFRSLIDLPIPEADQLKIMRAITNVYHQFNNIGFIKTRMSGKTRCIEMELYFDRHMTLEAIAALEQQIEADLRTSFSHLNFRLIPRISLRLD